MQDSPHPAGVAQLVTLDQLAVVVGLSKRSLERYKGRGLPSPVRTGRNGRAHLWNYTAVRSWLEDTFGVLLPERYPGIVW